MAAPASGPQTIAGRAPGPLNGFPSIIILEPQGAIELPPQALMPYMDQVQQTFIPGLLLVRTGQPTEFRNNDDVLHNVRVREDATRSPAFNVAIPTGQVYQFTFERDGFYDVGCDIHPGMTAQIVASASPYVTLADTEGHFTIDNVPPGSYKAIAYSGAQKIERTMNLPGQGALDLTTP